MENLHAQYWYIKCVVNISLAISVHDLTYSRYSTSTANMSRSHDSGLSVYLCATVCCFCCT